MSRHDVAVWGAKGASVSPGEAARLRRLLLLEGDSLLAELDSLEVPPASPEESVTRQALVSTIRRAVAEVRDALARLERGTFGVCEQCGRRIPLARLRALPRARLCVSCQRQEDARARALRTAHRQAWGAA